MLKHKHPGKRGKISLSRYFKEFKSGDSVAVTPELSEIFGYSTRLVGRTGKVLSKRGNAYHVEINDLNRAKRYLIKPIHLKKIEVAQ